MICLQANFEWLTLHYYNIVYKKDLCRFNLTKIFVVLFMFKFLSAGYNPVDCFVKRKLKERMCLVCRWPGFEARSYLIRRFTLDLSATDIQDTDILEYIRSKFRGIDLLNLKGNKITSIRVPLSEALMNVREIDLSDNNIEHVTREELQSLRDNFRGLKKLHLSGNPLSLRSRRIIAPHLFGNPSEFKIEIGTRNNVTN